ncbi:hypothetical protein C8F01DRAFT_1189587 [Mycena amicta]|nr:hypothetical protein C8F01DRAFT_1189587 [Mycena amicta]
MPLFLLMLPFTFSSLFALLVRSTTTFSVGLCPADFWSHFGYASVSDLSDSICYLGIPLRPSLCLSSRLGVQTVAHPFHAVVFARISRFTISTLDY